METVTGESPNYPDVFFTPHRHPVVDRLPWPSPPSQEVRHLALLSATNQELLGHLDTLDDAVDWLEAEVARASVSYQNAKEEAEEAYEARLAGMTKGDGAEDLRKAVARTEAHTLKRKARDARAIHEILKARHTSLKERRDTVRNAVWMRKASML